MYILSKIHRNFNNNKPIYIYISIKVEPNFLEDPDNISRNITCKFKFILRRNDPTAKALLLVQQSWHIINLAISRTLNICQL